ncbi:acyl-CoA dehydrogenase family protein [Vampirovibrio chlorellavorus]|uniref:acyl-CoA dehydrogenase family protein n=1 Tax=Vampirovibrio chlorellavorus TaxID=758823 RepID=UPI0026E9F948|nr:acyl-CoA dehydrogenase family protein [Vampirovibrio chlorellavorus]
MFLSDEQLSIRDLARDFVERELKPVVKQLETGDLQILKALWAKMAETGLTSLPFAEEFGGAAVDSLSYFLVLEEIAKVSAALATSLSVHVSLAGLPIQYYGTTTQKEQYLPDLVSGRKIGAFALTEPNAGSDAGAGLTTADKDGESYILNGSKLFITNALIGHVFIATARTDAKTPGPKGLSAFIIDRDTPGLTITKGDEKMGLLGGDWGELHFDNCRIAASQRLSDEGQGFKLFMRSLNIGRISIGAISLGLAQACLEASLQYARERQQFGKPIADFQAIQFKLADMALKIEAARNLVYNAARLKEAGKDFALEASMAKLYASEICNQCASEAVQIFGGYGYTKDFPVERYFRDARVMSLFEGTSEIQRTIIAKQLLA